MLALKPTRSTQNLVQSFALGALLVVSPWLWGGYPPWAREWLVVLLWVSVVLLASVRFLSKTEAWITVDWVEGVSLLLLLLGWGMTGNALFLHDDEFGKFVPLKQWAQGWPGSVEQSLSCTWMIQVTGLLALFHLTRRVCASQEQRETWLEIMGVTGVSIASLGLIERGLGATSILWCGGPTLPLFFSTFDYHGTAGAYLNVALPLVALKAWVVLDQKAATWKKYFWAAGFILVLAACFINASRAASFLSVLLLSLVAAVVRMKKQNPSSRPNLRWTGPLAAMGAGLILFAVLGGSRTWHRWQHFLVYDVWTGNGRWLEYQVVWRMVRVAGWMGFGPGTYQVLFPYYSGELGQQLPGRWLVAHEDYLQTVVEWGWCGAILWGMLWLGGGIRIFSRAWKNRGIQPLHVGWTDWGTALAWLGLALHGLVDYPLQIISLQIYSTVLLAQIFYLKPRPFTPPKRQE
jgi:O-antigen ligase